jgi:ABC-type proline/glycine betaine transport system permease subunit
MMIMVGIAALVQFSGMIGLLIQGKEVDPITLYILLGACIVLSIKLVIESVLNWVEAFNGTTKQATSITKVLSPKENKIVN